MPLTPGPNQTSLPIPTAPLTGNEKYIREALNIPQRQCADIRDFGAKGDGTTDDTAAIQAALDTGKCVFFPNGNYLVSDWLLLKCNGRRVIGESISGTVITTTSTTKGIFSVEENDSTAFPSNPPGVSDHQSFFGSIENFTLQAATESSGSGIRTVVSTHPSAPSWAGDGLQIANVLVQGFSTSGGVGYDIKSISKFYAWRVIAKNCHTGIKVWGSGSRCHQWYGVSASGCVIHVDLNSMIAGIMHLSDFAVSNAAVTTHHIRAVNTTATLIGGELEGNCLFIEATNSDISVQGSNLLVSSYATPPIVANATSDIYISGVDRQGHVAGTPLATSTVSSGRITGTTQKDFVSGTLGDNVNANAWQKLVWAQNRIVRIGALVYTLPDTFPTPTANMVGMLFATVGSDNPNHPGSDIRTVVEEQRTNGGTGTYYRWASLIRPSTTTYRVDTQAKANAHYGAPDVVTLEGSTGLTFYLNASSSDEYRAATRSGYTITIKNASAVTHTVAPNGTDTIDGSSGNLSLSAWASVKLFTLGDGKWFEI